MNRVAAIPGNISSATGISQNGAIGAALLIGFVVYLTIKGRLASYVNLLFKSAGKAASGIPTAQSNTTSPGSNTVPQVSSDTASGSTPLATSSGQNSAATFGSGSETDSYAGPVFSDALSTF